MERLPELQPGRYRHFKGNEYELLYVAPVSYTHLTLPTTPYV